MPAKQRVVLNFPYVCPEPVLVKRSCLVLKRLQKGVFRTEAVGEEHSDGGDGVVDRAHQRALQENASLF